ncbi:MAG: methyltransferase domain-containing protein [Actinobacteria bacterium]|nr:methyltransferase domain-containing protein [Actinomycetota bacterium]
MAEVARAQEGDAWTRAGIVPGAVVADVGCGPAAVTVAMADVVGEDGRVIGVEREPDTLAVAQRVVANAGARNVELRQGQATATGLEPGSLDVAVMRHVLAHNGGQEQAIVDHLASLVRPGGSVYVIDVDLTAIRILDADPDLDDLIDKYVEFHRRRGNDPWIGLRLGKLATAAGLTSVEHRGWYAIVQFVPGMRPPAWAARDAMMTDGIIDEDDAARWDAAFARTDAATVPPTLLAPLFSVVGRRPA